jgi:hypothetical protein
MNKYSGNYPIILKSSWEEAFAIRYCDFNPDCLEWAYEPCRIPYFDPISGRQTIYLPDFLISVKTNDGGINTSLIEIKPLKESLKEYAKSDVDQAIVLRNMAKWNAAMAWCQRRGNVKFLVLTEAELFPNIDIKSKKSKIENKSVRRRKIINE